MVKVRRFCFLVPIIYGLLQGVGLGTGAIASPLPSSVPVLFNIPVQPLASALYAYSVATTVQVVADGSLVSGRQSTALKGVFTPDAALQTILAGTGLAARRVAADAFILVPLPQEPATAPPPAPPFVPDYTDYSAVIQAALRQVLCQTGTTQPGVYRVAMQLWIDKSGTITAVNLLDSSGDKERDAALSSMLNHLALGSPPPLGLPQPVTLVILPRALVTTGDCTSAATH